LDFHGKVNFASSFLFGNRKTEHRQKRTKITEDSRRCFVVVHITDSMAAGQSCTRQSSALSLSLSLSPAVISRCRSWVMLLLVYMGPRATHFTGYCCWFNKVVGPQAAHFTGYCCWFMWGLGQHTLLGIIVVFMWGLGQHTLLGIVAWFTWASGNTHYWVLLLVYAGLGQHTLLDIVVGLCGTLGNTLYWV
jgi:hypothetical protein